MYSILVVDSGAIDHEVTHKVLARGLEGPIEFFSAIGSNDACVIMQKHSINLLIADVPQTTAYVKNLVRTAYILHNDIHVILTSVKSEEKIARLSSKVKATGYLLKPFPGQKLIDMVRPLERNACEAQVETEKKERDQCLESIAASIEDCQYKKSTETARKYLDFLYASKDNMSTTRMRVVEFVTALAELGKTQSQETQKRLGLCLKLFRTRYDLQSNPFEAALVVENMLDIVFAEMEQRQFYSGDDIKKVLNYIDRNIKKGITLDNAAEYINMSSSYFSKFFKKSTGANFITYVTDRKIEFAKEMLENTNMPVINIAYELSYNETNYFSKAFKKKVGVTPTEYREICIRLAKSVTAGV